MMIKNLLISRITLVWFILLGATLLSWEMGHGTGFDTTTYASITIILIAFVKVRFIMMEFMELREASFYMKLIADGWLIAISTLLVVLYLRPPALA